MGRLDEFSVVSVSVSLIWQKTSHSFQTCLLAVIIQAT
jgi:hypothetical protein